MKRFLAILPLLFIGIQVVAQQATSPKNVQPTKAIPVIGETGPLFSLTFNNRYEGVKGSPYFLETWGKGTFELHNKTLYEGLSLKYNQIDNTLDILNPDGKRLTIRAEHVSNFSITDTTGLSTFTFNSFNHFTGIDQSLRDKFYLTVYKGDKSELIVLPTKIFVKADYNGAYSMEKTTDEFLNEKTYYFIDARKTLQKLKLNRRNLLLVLDDKKEPIKEFVNKQKIDASTEKGWAKVLAHYDTL